MELFRIVSMVLVLVYHTNYLTFGLPSPAEAVDTPFVVFLRAFANGMSAVCVNCFVLLSGWFGIKPRGKRLAGFLFQVIFISAIGIFGMCLFTDHRLDSKDIKSIFLLTDNFWFVKSYLILYLLAPALNALAESAARQKFLLTLILLYALQSIWGWAVVTVPWVADGYSPLSFILLYLLARYLRLYQYQFQTVKTWYYLAIYLMIGIISAGITLMATRKGIDANMWLSSYASPLVIIGSISLLLWFSRLTFHSKVINWVAASSFAVYLLHCSRGVLDKFCALTRYMYEGCGIFGILCTIVVVFTLGVLVDKLRIIVWNMIDKVAKP